MNTSITGLLRRTGALLLGLSLLSACAAAAPVSQPAAPSQGLVAPSGGAVNQSSSGSSSGSEAKGAASDTATNQQDTARMIVRNATLTLIVKDTLATLGDISKLASSLNGYVASSSTHKYEEGVQGSVTLRVPADKLDTALDSLHKMATEVRDEQVTGEDVTAQYIDLNAQLTNLQAAELQLREIMSQTERTEDVLSVYNQLSQKQGEIEQVKGRIQYLSQSAAMATVAVTLTPDQLAQPVQIAGWHPEGVLKSAVEALIGGLQTLATIAIWLIVVVLPIGLIIASPFILLIVLLRRRNRRRPQQPPQPQQPVATAK